MSWGLLIETMRMAEIWAFVTLSLGRGHSQYSVDWDSPCTELRYHKPLELETSYVISLDE